MPKEKEYKVYAGVAYHIRGEAQLEFNPETPEKVGECIATLIKDERDAKNFTITIIAPDGEEDEGTSS